MRVVCPFCEEKALITSSNALTTKVKDLYCQCTNTQECGASFVFTLAFKHTLNPPQQTTLQIAAALVGQLTSEQQQQLQGDLFL